MTGFCDLVAVATAGLSADAKRFREYGADSLAKSLEASAKRVEENIREWLHETLTLDQAAKESGYTYGAIQGKVASGDLENVGAKNSPLVRRCDLPKKGGRARPTLVAGGEPDLAGDILLSKLTGS